MVAGRGDFVAARPDLSVVHPDSSVVNSDSSVVNSDNSDFVASLGETTRVGPQGASITLTRVMDAG
jgi:hypothetical protein